MNFDSLYDIQQHLDQRILDEHRLSQAEILPHKLLALQVELCELANETRCFKYWSQKAPAPQATILEEYVDALHFVLGLGLDLGYRNVPISSNTAEIPAHVSQEELTAQFQTLLSDCALLAAERTPEAFAMLFANLMVLGSMLGFSEVQIKTAYFEKNKINHLRQNEGY
ncbi:dUTP diphosphatase [Tumebacillus permanentifrigoris]|uniref:Dimeric dUTPase (All-alpha-NTP-PPase superfamily) n=1 Tax=Tumebacillus permanentifrigoris TaxID=378543 RepID=A0A316DDK6_9BACL|nr:dUTP diphosphatase [Tumebacillus permanentifrigoris]PWK13737.1 dimeric dUTPase (all-alpha-NTP-PPase superfamily) [Tumebacillus permanentifrigoris]